MNIDEAATKLEAICAQWGMPWGELKLDGTEGRPKGGCIVRMAITAQFLREVRPYMRDGGYASPATRLHCLTVGDVALLLGVAGRQVRWHLAELRRWLPVPTTLPVTARAMQPVRKHISFDGTEVVANCRMTGPDRASLEEEQLGGGLQ